jgi:hypothetical protein
MLPRPRREKINAVIAGLDPSSRAYRGMTRSKDPWQYDISEEGRYTENRSERCNCQMLEVLISGLVTAE